MMGCSSFSPLVFVSSSRCDGVGAGVQVGYISGGRVSLPADNDSDWIARACCGWQVIESFADAGGYDAKAVQNLRKSRKGRGRNGGFH